MRKRKRLNRDMQVKCYYKAQEVSAVAYNKMYGRYYAKAFRCF